MIEHDRPNQQGQDFTLTTKQLAEDLGISASLIHKLKSENPESLEGYWIKTDMNVLLWAESAKAVIEGIRSNGLRTESKDPLTGEDATADPLATSDLQSSDSTDALTLDTLAADFDNALRPHAQRIARERVARRFERLVAEAEQQEMARLIDAANRGDDESLYGFADPLFVVGAIPSSRNGHKALTGGAV